MIVECSTSSATPFDPISGLEPFHARWYAPDLGRFTALDPVGPSSAPPRR